MPIPASSTDQASDGESPIIKTQLVTTEDSDSEELLQQVANGDIAYTVADSNRLALQRRRYPNLAVAKTLNEDMPMAWALPLHQDDSVKAALIEYFGTVHQSGWFTVLEDKYFGTFPKSTKRNYVFSHTRQHCYDILSGMV